MCIICVFFTLKMFPQCIFKTVCLAMLVYHTHSYTYNVIYMTITYKTRTHHLWDIVGSFLCLKDNFDIVNIKTASVRLVEFYEIFC